LSCQIDDWADSILPYATMGSWPHLRYLRRPFTDRRSATDRILSLIGTATLYGTELTTALSQCIL